MQLDYIREFFSNTHTYLSELDKYICEDNVLYVENYLNKIELAVKSVRKKLKVSFRDLIKGKKLQDYMKSDEL